MPLSPPLLARSRTPISTSGWCSPVFINVNGPVNVTCKGVDPRALAVLNRNLGGLKLNYKQKEAEANDWAKRYNTSCRTG